MATLQKIAISCGGTGGHFYPGLSIAKAIHERDGDVILFLFGRHAKKQAEIAAKENIKTVISSIFRENSENLEVVCLNPDNYFDCFKDFIRKAFKKEISETDAMFWIGSSFIGLIFVIIPGSIDFLIYVTGVKYTPIAFLGIIILFLIVQNLKLVTKLYLIKKKQIKLTQEVALIDNKLNKLLKENKDE